MTPRIDARWHEIDALLDAVLDRPAPLREQWLRTHCDDAELRGMVLSLLAADAARGAGFEARAAAAHDWLTAHAAGLPEIPGYRVLGLAGEGGMASVFLAERVLGGTVQRVALKRLRLNVYDPAERRRFEHEHRVLARLEHPSIARLLDAGIAPDGVPWFAMEYVEGLPLLAWCDSRRLTIDARLAVFADICAAVQHAHQHLVVHRDLKPSNILLDEDGNVRLLDFGIARLLDPDTGPAEPTRTELRRLTPGYAAPEQYAGRTSTATDIYALGVILAELLGGQKPAGTHDAGSGRLLKLTVTREAAAARACSPRALQRLLAGDAGAIARKATRSEPALRYGSAQALADDVSALRDGRPVAARRGDWRYRTACFVRRNKTVVAAGLVVATTLVAATAVSLHQAREARTQAARAQAVQAFVEDMLAPLRSGAPVARMPRLDAVIAQGVRDLEARRLSDPAVYSDLLVLFARTYERMDERETAHALATRAHDQAAMAFGPDDVRTLRALALRGSTRLDTAAGVADVQAALARMRRRGIAGAPLAEVLDALGSAEVMAWRPKQALPLVMEAQRQRERFLAPDHPDLALGYSQIGRVHGSLGDPDTALAYAQKAYRHSARHLGPRSRQAATHLGEVAEAKVARHGWLAGAQDYERALQLLARLDPDGGSSRLNLLIGACANAVSYDDLVRAARYCEAAVPIAAREGGEGSRMHHVARRQRMMLLTAQGRLEDARAESATLQATAGTAAGEAAQISQHLLRAVASDIPYVEGNYAALRDTLLPLEAGDHRSPWPLAQAWMLARLALACAHAPDPACPADLVERAEGLLARAKLPAADPLRAATDTTLARVRLQRGDPAGARRRLDAVLAAATSAPARLRPGHRLVAEARMWRGDALAAQGDIPAALGEWRAAEALFAPRYAASHPFRRHLAGRLRSVAGDGRR